jgi:hypothetical protein
MTVSDSPPDSSGVGLMILGTLCVAVGPAALAGIGYCAYEGAFWLLLPGWSGWLVLAIYLCAGLFVAGFAVVLLAGGLPALSEGIEKFRTWRASPVRRPLWDHLKEFLEDISEDAPEPADAAVRDHRVGLIDIDRLPPEVAAVVRPFLPEGTRFIKPEQIRELLTEATRLLQAREAFTRQEKTTIDRQTDLDLSRARAAYVAGLTEEERAILAAERRR